MNAIQKILLAASVATSLAACDIAPRRALPSELDGAWVVQEIAGAPLGEAVEVYLAIDADTGGVAGFTGCTRFTTSMQSFSAALAVGPVTTEPGECASAAAEIDHRRFLGVLPYVQRYARRGKSLELLPGGHGEALLRLRVDNFATLTRMPAGDDRTRENQPRR